MVGDVDDEEVVGVMFYCFIGVRVGVDLVVVVLEEGGVSDLYVFEIVVVVHYEVVFGVVVDGYVDDVVVL